MKIPKKEEGQGLVEYALLLTLVAIVIIAILTILGSQVMIVFARVSAGLNGQVITGQGKEAVVTGYETVIKDNGPTCEVTVTDISFVGLEDGALIKDDSVTVYFTLGDNTQDTSGSTGANGTGTASGPLKFSGTNCNNVRPGQ